MKNADSWFIDFFRIQMQQQYSTDVTQTAWFWTRQTSDNANVLAVIENKKVTEHWFFKILFCEMSFLQMNEIILFQNFNSFSFALAMKVLEKAKFASVKVSGFNRFFSK